jgi:pimeloyl-ACP methyl ester carboxylesterase
MILFLWSVLSCYCQERGPVGILFIHGLAGDHTIWDESIKDLTKDFACIDGNFKPDLNSGTCFLNKPDFYLISNPGLQSNIHLFTLDFSDNQNFTFEQQGEEVRLVIEKIRFEHNIQKIMLVGHSMGGLAARAYLMAYGSEGIVGLVTASTPHLGSFLGYAKDILMSSDVNVNDKKIVNDYLLELAHLPELKALIVADIRTLIKNKIGLDIYSAAMDYLKPDNQEMQNLYQQIFPIAVPVAIIYSQDMGKNAYSKYVPLLKLINDIIHHSYKLNRESVPIDIYPLQLQQDLTDGVVTIPSQDIKLSLANGNQIHPHYFSTNMFHMDVPRDVIVMRQAILSILEPTPQEAVPDFSIGFLIDSSGSMTESDPKDIRKSAMVQLLNYIDPQDDLFIVDFDQDAKWLNENNYRNWNQGLIVQSIQGIDSKGNTDIGAGIRKMKQLFENRLVPGKKFSIILFTDGKGDYSNDDEWFVQNKIPIYTVSYKDNADSRLLSKIAMETGGKYIRADDDLDIVVAFYQFINEYKDQSWICKYADRITQNQQIAYAFNIDRSIKSFRTLASWYGSSIDYTLIDPLGKIYTSANVIESTSGANFLHFKITKPTPGKWTVTFYGKDVPQGPEDFIFNVCADNKNEIKLGNASVERGWITCVFQNEQEFKNNTVTPVIILNTPQGEKMDISSSFKNGKMYFLPTYGNGDYKMSIDLTINEKNGNLFQRHYERSISVGDTMTNGFSVISSVQGNFIKASLGKNVGNRPGIFCYILDSTNSNGQPKAKGLVTYVTEIECQIEIQQYYGNNYFIKPNDLVKLDLIQWQNDKLK